MKSALAAGLTALVLLGGCSSGAAPGSGDVVDQVDKATDVGAKVEERNSELLENSP